MHRGTRLWFVCVACIPFGSECIRDKISDYFMKQSYTASADLMGIFGTILGDKMLWNLLIKGLFHHLHYIPKAQLNLINDQLSSRISQLQHQQIQQRELALEIKSRYHQQIMNGKPEFDSADDSGSITALWRISEPNVQNQISKFFASRPIYLADGHHRYEAARQYQLDRHAEDPGTKSTKLAHNFVMMTLIAFDDPGLVVLGYHRTLNDVPDDKLAKIKAKLNQLFDSEPANGSSNAVIDQVGRLGVDRRLLASVDSGGAKMLTLKESAIEPDWGPLSASEAWVLEEQVLKPGLGDATLEHLDFMHDHEKAVEQAKSGELQMVFLLKPFPLDAFESIVGGGQRLPRKSTFFYPKLPTGLVINRIDGEL